MIVITLSLLGILLAAFAIGMHVATTLGFTALSSAWLFSDRPLWDVLAYIPWNVMTTSSLVALPLFILMGEMLLRTGITEAMYIGLSKWLGWVPGSLLHTNVVASGLFACISGSSAATAATIGGVAVPFMRRRGFDNRLTLGSIAAGGTLGILIPPSIAMIVYAVMVEESVGRLYMAGVIPGLLMMGMFMLTIFIAVKIDPSRAPDEPPVPWGERFSSLVSLLPVLFLIGLVLGTIYVGVATATEAAAFGVSGALILAIYYRRLTLKMLREAFLATAATTGMIMFILVGAFIMQFIVAFLGIPAAITQVVTGLDLTPTQFVIMLCVFYIILGTFMESLSMIVITIPILLPVMRALGIDMVWFGVIAVILIETALISPPVGLNLFILQTLARGDETVPNRTADVFVGVLPFLVAMLATLALVVAFPGLSLWLSRSAL
jgi:tripartite ATP-independent transporter DctM subunit